MTKENFKNPKRVYQGMKNRAAGKMFEDRLDRTFEYYRERGFALIDKTPEPMHIIRSLEQGKFIASFEKKAQPDYKGTLKGGRAVMFEAKFTETEKLTQERVSEHQQKYLEEQFALGARCYVIAGFKDGTVYRVPWETWRDMKTVFGHKYVTQNDLKPYMVKPSWNGVLLILD